MAKVKKKSGLTTGDNDYLDQLLGLGFGWFKEESGSFWKPEQVNVSGITTITYFFSDDGSGGAWTVDKYQNFKDALETWSNVAKIRFVEVDKAENADWVETLESWDYDEEDSDALSRHESPADLGEGATQAKGVFNVNHDSWTDGYSGAGSAVYHAFVREIGHALGLEYSDDVFDGSNNELWGELNSAMGSWAGTPGFTTHGSAAGPMAYDIEAIQRLYGANETYADGRNVYELKDFETPEFRWLDGANWKSIWDKGGYDEIVYNGEKDAVINLNSAKLDGSETGGGPASYAVNGNGGFTIAHGVDIENASGGSGDDRLIGNSLDNRLYGNGGDDVLIAGPAGTNKLYGGDGRDTFYGGDGNDTFYVDNEDFAFFNPFGPYSGPLVGGGGVDRIIIDDDDGATITLVSGNSIFTGAQSVREVFGGNGDDVIHASDLVNQVRWGEDTGLFLSGGGGDDVIFGTILNDEIFGGSDDDTIFGVSGADTVLGGGGDDTVMVGSNVDGASFHGDWDQDTLDFSGLDGLNYGEYPVEAHLELDAGFGEIQNTNLGSVQSFDQDGFENVIGGFGNDRITGDDQRNVLTGNLGEDVIRGGQGNDTLTGGAAPWEGDGQRDDFEFGFGDGIDRITDFEHGIDKIVFSQLEVKDFKELTLTTSGNSTLVSYGYGQDGIWLDKVGASIDAGDFLLT